MPKTGRLIKFDTTDPVSHLSSLEAIWRELDGKNTAPVLVFRHLDPCVLLGSSQVAGQAADIAYCRSQNIPVIRRPSEGGTIYADENCLLYSLIVTVNKAAEVFEGFQNAIMASLAGLGLQGKAKPPNDILVNNKKIAGLTVTQWYSITSLSGTLLLDTDPINLDRIIGRGTAEKLAGVNQFLPDKVKTVDLAAIITNKIEAWLEISFETTGLTGTEKEVASELMAAKYGSEKWNRIQG